MPGVRGGSALAGRVCCAWAVSGLGEVWRASRGRLVCPHCRRQTSVLAGTVFHRTRDRPCVCGFSLPGSSRARNTGANALRAPARARTGFRYKTAWVWLHKLRRAMVRPDRDQLSGVVQVDESYVGGVGGWSAVPRDDQEGHCRDRRRGRRTQDREQYGCVARCPTSPLRFCEASSRIASHRQARCIPTDGQAIRDSPNWAFATRSRTSRPPAIPLTCSCRPYIGWRLSSSAGSSEPSKEGSPANTSPTIWTSSPFASTDAHPRARGLLFYRLLEQAVQCAPTPASALYLGTGRGKRCPQSPA